MDPDSPSVVEAYLFFAKMVTEYLDDDPEELPFDLVDLSVGRRAHALVEAVIRNFQLVTIELEAEDDAQVIFETLNARGAPLTPSDLVRNFIFLTATRRSLDVTRLYNDLWRNYEEGPESTPFWKQVERQGRLKRARLDLFLFHYLTFRTGEELKIGHVYQAFRDWWEDAPERDLEQELAELQRFSHIYRMLLAPDGATPSGRSFNRLRILDTTTAYPVILWAAGELGVDSEDFLEILTDIESFIVRRVVCGHNQKAYNRLFLDLLGRLRGGDAPDPPTFRRLLGSSSAESALWPSNEDFQRHLVRDPLYKSIGPRRTEMILEALEQKSRHPYGERVTIHSTLTVEHVLPQGASDEDWPLHPKDGEDYFDAMLHRKDVVTHRLGNLTLLTQPLNSAVSNGAFSIKQAEIGRVSQLQLNKYFAGVSHWDEEAIELRGRQLADLALEIWPGPNR